MQERNADREVLKVGRVSVAPAAVPGNAGIRARYPIDLAHWVWLHPRPQESPEFAEFALDVEVEDTRDLQFEVSADQRFILKLNDREVGRGPDRCELAGWSQHRYRITVEAGRHRLTALVWWLPRTDRPCAQVSARAAFALVGMGDTDPLLSTGKAPWQVREIHEWRPLPKAQGFKFHVIGCGFEMDKSRRPGPWQSPVVVERGSDERTGQLTTPWRCEPSPLPEQARSTFSGGRIRAVQPASHGPVHENPPATDWQKLTRGEAVVVPPQTHLFVLWDFEEYVCGYPRVDLDKGRDSRVAIEWAESLFEVDGQSEHRPKGQRDDCDGKWWFGFGDRLHHAGGRQRYEALWWRSGRWLRMEIWTGDEPLVIGDVRPLQTAHPYQRQWEFEADGAFAPMLQICEKGLLNCTHETFVDCPYYEQMQYVGDTRTQALTWLNASGDPRPVRRALDLFDRSRWMNGFVAERTPSGVVQMSATYSLLQPLLLRDYAWWVDDAAGVRALLPGTRSAMEAALACLDDQHLPVHLPGWLFVDWVHHPEWQVGVPGESRDLRAPIALHLPLALNALAEIESAYGEALMAERWLNWSDVILKAILDAFWKPAHGLIADDVAATAWSEHAQALALLCTNLPPALRPDLLKGLLRPADNFARASVYFSYYVHEALLQAGQVGAFLDRLDFWKALVDQGFVTTVEAPEPSRSDCHGWGAHPLHHCMAGLAGIRPSLPGFAAVEITPQPGPLEKITARLPHPKGFIRVQLDQSTGKLAARIDSPVPGTLVVNQQRHAFAAGSFRLGD